MRGELAELSLDDLALAKPDAPLVTLLRNAVRTGSGIHGIRFSNNVMNGTVIEDAYIYRLNWHLHSTNNERDRQKGLYFQEKDRRGLIHTGFLVLGKQSIRI